MSDEEIRRTFAKNMKKYLEINGKQPADLVHDLHLPFSTVSNWINGIKLPRMGKVELLAHYFGIEKSDLLEEKEILPAYYMPDEMILLELFRQLNDSGRTEALTRLQEMTSLEKYTKK